MKRVSVLLACALLMVSCDRDRAPEDAPAPDDSAPAASELARPEEPEAVGEEPAELQITDEMVAKYVEYEKENVRILRDYVAAAAKNLQSARGDSVKTLEQVAVSQKFTKELEEKLEAKRQELGLSERELAAAKDAAQMTATARVLYQQMGGDAQLASMEAEQQKAIEALPQEQRAAAIADMEKMLKGVKDMRDAAEVRKKYGDKSADAVLRHADVLVRQRLEVLQMMSRK